MMHSVREKHCLHKQNLLNASDSDDSASVGINLFHRLCFYAGDNKLRHNMSKRSASFLFCFYISSVIFVKYS